MGVLVASPNRAGRTLIRLVSTLPVPHLCALEPRDLNWIVPLTWELHPPHTRLRPWACSSSLRSPGSLFLLPVELSLSPLDLFKFRLQLLAIRRVLSHPLFLLVLCFQHIKVTPRLVPLKDRLVSLQIRLIPLEFRAIPVKVCFIPLPLRPLKFPL